MIIDERVGFALRHFQQAGGVLIELHDFCERELCFHQIDRGCSESGHDFLPGSIQFRGIGNGRVFRNEQRQSDFAVGIREIDGLAALWRVRHGGKDDVDFAGFQSGLEALKCDNFDLQWTSEFLSEGLCESYGHAVRFACGIRHFKRGSAQFHPDAKWRGPGCGLLAAASQDRGDENEKE